MRKRILFFVTVLLWGVLACNVLSGEPTSTPFLATPVVVVDMPTDTPAPAGNPDPTTAPPTQSPADTPVPVPTPHSWPPPVNLPGLFDPNGLTQSAQNTFTQLSQLNIPTRDDVALAIAYYGITDIPPLVAPLSEEILLLQTEQTFNILNFDNNTVIEINAVLLGVSEHAYFWFDTGPAGTVPTIGEVQALAVAFDDAYEQVSLAFGNENNPGIDGDTRIHIVHASPAVLCLNPASCGLAGYFSSFDVFPAEVNPTSNEHEMFVMNSDVFGRAGYLSTLAHEFRHMVEDNYDRSGADWEVEGSAVLAEELSGYGIASANPFLFNPDLQLNTWSDSNTYPHYIKGYVMSRYIYQRLGPDLYREYATHPANGLAAVTAIAENNGLDFTGESLWLDWLAALALHNEGNVSEQYRFIGANNWNTVAMEEVTLPANYDTTVHQYGVDYYRLTGNGEVTINFNGSLLASVLGTQPPSGEMMWYAGRANYSNPRLTRAFDLSNVASATLNYDVFRDIEVGYDFAYVSISTDGGQTWQGLTAPGMEGLEAFHDPSESAFSDRFYTGRGNTWISETIDLTPYTGQTIHLRWEYITDPILTFGGFAIDNISIPEIGFYDDVEAGNSGWTAVGFAPVTPLMPQQWHLQLITFDNGTPQVTLPPLTNNALSHTLSLDTSDGQAILIISASAPLTLEIAPYQLLFE